MLDLVFNVGRENLAFVIVLGDLETTIDGAVDDCHESRSTVLGHSCGSTRTIYNDEIFIVRIGRRFSTVSVIVPLPVQADLLFVDRIFWIDESSAECEFIVIIFGPRVFLTLVSVASSFVDIGSVPGSGMVCAFVHGEFVADAMRFR